MWKQEYQLLAKLLENQFIPKCEICHELILFWYQPYNIPWKLSLSLEYKFEFPVCKFEVANGTLTQDSSIHWSIFEGVHSENK